MVDSTPPPAQAGKMEMYGIRENDPSGELVDLDGLTDEDIAQITRLMRALGELREVEREVSEASAKYMELNETDMRALHYLMVCENQKDIATPSKITKHLNISPASTTKLLDRLEMAEHITRSQHPSDRRALQIRVNPATRKAAYETVGRLQSRRFYAAAHLSPHEREIVIQFLQDMAERIDMKNVDWTKHD
ncbi:MarR family winged helix-turn-helix transcriptional regulator [Flaviflexus equikiangi]|uniref:MarR family transcriptional regulator n=1 Tax=Flaviflexus equikiangi TaxID=2758573 RepID=A0ABS2TE52_9ACTO|nr:MarR family transcriptional regulator [Flaviflexus equikiangi]MBM9432912.1 MarR family transcriptional regulator [Flaviflexus equikiangi]